MWRLPKDPDWKIGNQLGSNPARRRFELMRYRSPCALECDRCLCARTSRYSSFKRRLPRRDYAEYSVLRYAIVEEPWFWCLYPASELFSRPWFPRSSSSLTRPVHLFIAGRDWPQRRLGSSPQRLWLDSIGLYAFSYALNRGYSSVASVWTCFWFDNFWYHVMIERRVRTIDIGRWCDMPAQKSRWKNWWSVEIEPSPSTFWTDAVNTAPPVTLYTWMQSVPLRSHVTEQKFKENHPFKEVKDMYFA